MLGLGEVARSQNDVVEAAKHYAESLEGFRQVGDLGGIAMAQHNLGYVALRSGEVQEARRAFQEALSASVELRQTDAIASCLAGLAAVAAAMNDSQRSARLFGMADALLETSGVTLGPADRGEYEHNAAALRAQMGDAAADAAWAEGRRLSLGEAVALALAVGEVDGGRGGFETRPYEPHPDDTRPDETGHTHAGPDENLMELPLVRLTGLGIMRVTRYGAVLTPADGLTGKARDLLFYLASHSARPMQQIGADLWPDASKQQLRTAFHNTLHSLRRALGGRDWVTTTADGYALNHDLGYWYDVEQFRALASASNLAPTDAEEAKRRLQEALSLYQGDFLTEMDADWVKPLRNELRLVYRNAALALGRRLMEGNRYADAATVYRTLIARDSYVEEAYRELMRCLSRNGERAQALRVYQELAGALERDMGVTPAPETRRIFELLRSGEEI